MNEEQAYMVAYIVQRGWRYEDKAWRKDGFVHETRNWINGRNMVTDSYDLGEAFRVESTDG
jgi:hypothetical protein